MNFVKLIASWNLRGVSLLACSFQGGISLVAMEFEIYQSNIKFHTIKMDVDSDMNQSGQYLRA